jgi:replicative DNA helicase
MANNKAYDRIKAFLAPEHFADPIHARLYKAIIRRIEAGQIADAITLKAEFEQAGTLDEMGGAAYLAQLLTAMASSVSAADHGGAIRGAWFGRLLVGVGTTLLDDETGSTASDPQDNTAAPEDQVLLDLAEDEAHRLVGIATQDDPTSDREARRLLDRINTGLDEAHARADRLLARLN